MQFIPLDNWKNMVSRQLTVNSNTPYTTYYKITDTSLAEHTLTSVTSLGETGGLLMANVTPITTDTYGVDFPHASSYDSFDLPQFSDKLYQVPDVVGTSKIIGGSPTPNGFSKIIEVTANEGDIIKSIFFTRRMRYTSSLQEIFLLYALKLDTPVELNAENNYTANFLFAIEF